MTDTVVEFDQMYADLTGFAPYPWQQRLYERMVAGDWPTTLDIPTGLGKTSIMTIWLIALALSEQGAVPRRLVYVVNRRTIVDQATRVAEKLREQFADPDSSAATVCRDRLLALAGRGDASRAEDCLAISTLRGQFADNQAWLRDPAQPAIVVGTVDMIGSRLLFRAYRAGWKQRARQAGLIGHDSLIVHDEAHLTEPFQRLLKWAQATQAPNVPGDTAPLCPMRVVQMSATSASGTSSNSSASDLIRLDGQDEAVGAVAQRLHAVKRLALHPTEKKDQDRRLVELAVTHETEGTTAPRVIVFVRSPEDAWKVYDKLSKTLGTDRVALLTGTIRGYERDGLLDRPVMKALLGEGVEDRPQRTMYLVSTSAGEVGADFDADHLVCDQTTLSSFVQRLGRVNRRGGAGRSAMIDLVHGARPAARPSPYEAATLVTLELLQTLPAEADDGRRDVSPIALRCFCDGLASEAQLAANDPPASWTPPHPAVLDAWSLTSIRESWPLAHDLQPYLHGTRDEDDPAETQVAWRAELDLFMLSPSDDLAPLEARLSEWFAGLRLRTHETLRETVRMTGPNRLVALLEAVKEHRCIEPYDVWFVTLQRGETRVHRLASLDDRAIRQAVRGATVILPASFGGLCRATGMLDPAQANTPAVDVADEYSEHVEPRDRYCLTKRDDDTWTAHRLPDHEPLSTAEGATYKEVREAVMDKAGQRAHRLVTELPIQYDDDGDVQRALLLVASAGQTHSKTEVVPLSEHVDAVRAQSVRIARSLLPQTLHATFERAAVRHDSGKGRRRWQEAVRNFAYPDTVLAKPGRRGMNVRLLDGYRHEFGSLTDVYRAPDNDSAHDGDGVDHDLLLHLIASHHGRARPHFPRGAFDPDRQDEDVPDALSPAAIACRFDHLQRRYGHWGLAWLEGLFMAADAAGSADAEGDET